MPLRPGQVIEVTGSTEPLLGFARMIQVRHRSHATYSRQPRQVRKEATVTGSCVCSGSPVPGFFFPQSWPSFTPLRHRPLPTLYNSLRKRGDLASSLRVKSNITREENMRD